MLSFLWALIIGGIIGWVASMIVGRDVPGGIIGNIIAGFIGAWLGSLILGDWGPVVADFAIIPALIGAILLVFIVSLIMKSMRKSHD
ncbi:MULTISPECIES: GlsB/YeaQ/YmgE family stress response membrane protein [Cytobacillus]|uniref:GlsB/YeaQ/YmgE family stress response membrane protein n=1 Tax=Cytobacillus TaxID=2675230 RepID=UPI00203EDFD2|nr:GlsB/YeaQ/YmgE family stress response membrane protein [Cytobacillus firmus]MCM3706250.1 GlsB/YeaQ/YmgE family stress response membrane protein [Cytobacillus firmus]